MQESRSSGRKTEPLATRCGGGQSKLEPNERVHSLRRRKTLTLRSCIRSPACCAPASEMPPATRFATTFPGCTTANKSWLIFPMAETLQ